MPQVPTLRKTTDLALVDEVRYYLSLSPRQLPSRALYDPLGSALFDAICRLPWYPITRAERRLITQHRVAILEAAGRPRRLIELGGGNGEKLALLLGRDELTNEVRRVDLVDVSTSALAAATRLLRDQRDVAVVTHRCQYEDGLVRAVSSRSTAEGVLVLFLGSNIGNFDPPAARAFLTTIRNALGPGDGFLIGADLIKSERALLLAYDDPLGVTAAFNKNLLVRLNRELKATFDINQFDHRAVWNRRESRVEMHLVSRRRQRVDIRDAGLSVDLAPGEPIWTESSYKYDVARFDGVLEAAGLETAARWTDETGQFLLSLARPQG